MSDVFTFQALVYVRFLHFRHYVTCFYISDSLAKEGLDVWYLKPEYVEDPVMVKTKGQVIVNCKVRAVDLNLQITLQTIRCLSLSEVKVPGLVNV